MYKEVLERPWCRKVLSTKRYYGNEETGRVELEKREVRPIEISDIEVISPDNYLGDIKKSEKKAELVPGKLYRYSGKVFRLVKILNVADTSSLVFKQLVGSGEGYIYLGEKDCELFGIRYEPGLLTLPRGYDYEPIGETEVQGFTETDLSSYPRTVWGFQDNRDPIIVRLGGFKPREDPNLIQYKDILIELEPFLVSLKVVLKKNISRYKDSSEMWKDDMVSFGILPGDTIRGSLRLSDQHIIDSSGNLYLFLDFRKNSKNISMLSLTGKNIRDLVKISFDSAFSINSDSDIDISILDTIEKIESPGKLFRESDGIWWRNVKTTKRGRQLYAV